MTSALYVCAEEIQEGSGGGLVVTQERQALGALGFDRVFTLSGQEIDPLAHSLSQTPFLNDMLAAEWVWTWLQERDPEYKPVLAHFYSGTFSTTVRHLKARGVPVSYTIPAHDRRVTIEEHKNLTGGYPWPHIGDDFLWKIFSAGYREADLVIAPSKSSAAFLSAEGCRNVQVIPHGCHLPDRVEPLPQAFAAGYMGQVGVDKGLVYLFRAWGKLNYPDATLILAGVGSEQLRFFISQSAGGGKFSVWGYIPEVSKLYNAISVYVQPSVCEGFGIEVLEAFAHGRPAIVSQGAGAADVVSEGVDGWVVPIRDPDAIAERLDWCRRNPVKLAEMGKKAREKAGGYTWEKIRERYKDAWRKLLTA